MNNGCMGHGTMQFIKLAILLNEIDSFNALLLCYWYPIVSIYLQQVSFTTK